MARRAIATDGKDCGWKFESVEVDGQSLKLEIPGPFSRARCVRISSADLQQGQFRTRGHDVAALVGVGAQMTGRLEGEEWERIKPGDQISEAEVEVLYLVVASGCGSAGRTMVVEETASLRPSTFHCRQHACLGRLPSILDLAVQTRRGCHTPITWAAREGSQPRGRWRPTFLGPHPIRLPTALQCGEPEEEGQPAKGSGFQLPCIQPTHPRNN
jgi:hypothetical protein